MRSLPSPLPHLGNCKNDGVASSFSFFSPLLLQEVMPPKDDARESIGIFVLENV